jgi:hypothetical protein
MTFQIPDTLVICSIAVGAESPCKIPSKHSAIIDVSKPKPGDPRIPMPKKCSALHRGYLAKWEIEEDGRLFLTSLSGQYDLKESPLLADWVKATFQIPVGEVDETLTEKARYETIREYCLELRVQEGAVTQWRLVKEGSKGTRWNEGFDWAAIKIAMEEVGIGAEWQPARYEAPKRFENQDFASLAEESAALLRLARSGEKGAGKVISVDAWKELRKGWADPFPELDVHAAVRTFRGHGPSQEARK